ncbi:hypothetical protein EIP86_010869 [Pleurotus ostreatoroseus]|nr:hypothetical protein EIP86_010869 [Pleurotus ostreatoroseus]
MKSFAFTSLVCAAASALAAPANSTAQTASLTYSQQYDNPKISLNAYACSNGPHGFEAKGYTTIGQVPGFPNVGAAFAVGGWDSPNCGTCWKLTYEGASINIVAVDHAAEGSFNIALSAMDKLTGGKAIDLGRVDVQYEQVDAAQCQ